MSNEELGKRAHANPEALQAWLGPIRASTRLVSKGQDGSVRWEFDWVFKRDEVLGSLEFIVDHELFDSNVDHAWIGARVPKGTKFHSVIVVDREGIILYRC